MKASSSKERVQFLLVSAVVGLSLLGDALLYAVLPARPEEFHVLVWQIGLLLGANRLVRLITNELAGRMVSRHGSRKPLILAVIIGSLVTASYALPWGFWGLFAVRITWGACWSILRVEGYVSALNLATDRNRGRIFAAFQAMARAGSGGGVLLGGFLSDLIGIKITFLIFSIITASGLILVLKIPPDHERVPDSTGARAGSRVSRSSFLKGKYQVFLWSCAFAIAMTEQMMANLTGRLVVDRIAPDLPYTIGIVSLTGLLLGFRSLGSLVFGPLAGFLSDLMGRQKLLLIICLIQIAVISGLIFSGYWFLTLILLLVQFMIGISERLLISAMAGDSAPHDRPALYMSRFSTFNDLGTALGPIAAFGIYACLGFFWVGVLVLLLIFFVLASVYMSLLSSRRSS